MHTFKKNTTSKGSVAPSLKALFIALLGVLGFNSASAQSQDCLVNSLNISTGWDHDNNAPFNLSLGSFIDPHWQVVAVSTAVQTATGMSLPFTPGIVPTGTIPGWVNNSSNSHWLDAVPAYYNTTDAGGPYEATFRRVFTLCQADEINFDLKVAADNKIISVSIDGSPVSFSNLPQSTWSGFTAMTILAAFNQNLSASTHTIDVVVENWNTVFTANPHAFNMEGTISSVNGNNSIVNNTSGCSTYKCPNEECSDICYWKVKGNTILNGNNIFGTNSRHDVIMRTSGVNRGKLTSGTSVSTGDDGRFGWQTLTPTAHLHVNCIGGNEEGSGTSDIRFEELEKGAGKILVIDENGYVYNSDKTLTSDGTIESMMVMYKQEKERADQMENDIKDLRAQLATLKSQTTRITDISSHGSSVLYQNTPNPFGNETVIAYDVHEGTSAFIIIYDLNGREISKFPAKMGKGSVTVNSGDLASGTYIYSLVIEGREFDSKRMILTR